jgi:hypothetical protein
LEHARQKYGPSIASTMNMDGIFKLGYTMGAKQMEFFSKRLGIPIFLDGTQPVKQKTAVILDFEKSVYLDSDFSDSIK